MKTRFYILPLLCCVLIWGCKNAEKAKDEFSIQGKVQGLESKVMHFERIQPTKSEPLQDIQLDAEGRFSLTQKGEPNTLFQLRADDGRRMLFLPEFDALEIEADADELDAYQVQGGEKTKRLRDFNLKQYRLYIDYANAEAQLDGLDRQKDTLAWHELEGVTDRAMVAYGDFLRSFCDTVNLPILRAHASLSIVTTGNYYYLSQIGKRIRQEMPGSHYADAIQDALTKEGEGRVGTEAPMLRSTDLQGQPFDLASLRGKRVLLVFWASYCEFSQMEFAKIKDMGPLFKDSGTTLVCFSIDDHEAEWREFLKNAGLDFAIHVRGLTGQQSAEIKNFRVKAIPSTYVINAKGTIETLDIRSQDLQAYLMGGSAATPNPAAGQ